MVGRRRTPRGREDGETMSEMLDEALAGQNPHESHEGAEQPPSEERRADDGDVHARPSRPVYRRGRTDEEREQSGDEDDHRIARHVFSRDRPVRSHEGTEQPPEPVCHERHATPIVGVLEKLPHHGFRRKGEGGESCDEKRERNYVHVIEIGHCAPPLISLRSKNMGGSANDFWCDIVADVCKNL